MILVDTNVLVYAARRDAPHHAAARQWLVPALAGEEAILICDDVLAATIRILTNHRILPKPQTPAEALEFCEAVRTAPAAVSPPPSPQRWRRFARLVSELGFRGNDIPDVLIAATALDQGAQVATFDRGFRRFPGVGVILLPDNG